MDKTLIIVCLFIIVLLLINAIIKRVLKSVIPFITASAISGIGLSKIIPNDGSHKHRGALIVLASILSGAITKKTVEYYDKKVDNKTPTENKETEQFKRKNNYSFFGIKKNKHCSKCGRQMEAIPLNRYDRKTGQMIFGYECPIKTNLIERYPCERRRGIFGVMVSDKQWDDYNHDSDRENSATFKYWADFVPD